MQYANSTISFASLANHGGLRALPILDLNLPFLISLILLQILLLIGIRLLVLSLLIG